MHCCTTWPPADWQRQQLGYGTTNPPRQGQKRVVHTEVNLLTAAKEPPQGACSDAQHGPLQTGKTSNYTKDHTLHRQYATAHTLASQTPAAKRQHNILHNYQLSQAQQVALQCKRVQCQQFSTQLLYMHHHLRHD